MEKNLYTRKELTDIVHAVFSEEPRPKIYDEILKFLEIELFKYINSLVEERQKKIQKLSYYDNSKRSAVWNGTHLPSCESCISNTSISIVSSLQCNSACKFCSMSGEKTPLAKNMVQCNNERLSIYTFKNMLFRSNSKFLSLRRGDATIELDKLKEIMPYASSLGMYQWLYTDGVSLTEDKLKQLKEFGLNEIRFNLQASYFSKEVIEKIELATKYIEHVVPESPVFSWTYNNFYEKIPLFIDMGIKNVNIYELVLFEHTLNDFIATDGFVYRSNGRISPISSIMYMYDLLEKAEEMNWDITINACSNTTKIFDNRTSMLPLPIPSYLFIINAYFDDTGNETWEVF